jgi:hypothetical protein
MVEDIEEVHPDMSKTCEICYEECKNDEFFTLESCGHKFCKSCTREHIKQQIMNAKVLRLKCCMHDCQLLFEDHHVLMLFSDI